MKTKNLMIAGVVTTLMLFTCQTTQAQLKYGIHAGMNLETQAQLGELWNNVDLYQGFLVGGFLEYGFGNKLSLQTELNYQKKGQKVESTTSGVESISRREFNYLSVPLLVKGTFHDDGLSEKIDLTCFAGPYAGYLTSANSRLKVGETTTPVKIDNLAEKFDMGAIFGGGIVYKLTNGGAIVAELRYEMGLIKIDKQNTDLRNKGMGLTIGYRF
jgi:hypothetical protein